MIIIQVFYSFYPVSGGIEIAMQRICEELARMGHEVHVIAGTLEAEDRPRYEEINGVCIHRVKTWTLHYPVLTIPGEVSRDILKKVDIVHGWSHDSFFTYRICRETKKLRKPIVIYFLGVDYLKWHYNPLIRVFGYRYQKWMTKKIVKITDLALVTNEYEKEILREKYGLDAIILPHGVDKIYLKTPNMADYFREKYEVRGRIVSYIARIHPTKGLDLLVKSFAEVVKYMPDVFLIIAGKGDEGYLKECLKLAEKLGVKDRVSYLGYISEEDKIALIDASDVVVLPTRHSGENYSLLVDEVVARGRSMVVTNVSKALASRAEKLDLIVTPPEVLSLASSIIKALNSETSHVHGMRKVLTWQEITQELLEIYDKVLKGLREDEHLKP